MSLSTQMVDRDGRRWPKAGRRADRGCVERSDRVRSDQGRA